jgi:hypothetical protein
MDLKIAAAIAAIPETAWTAIRYPRAIWDGRLRAWVSDAEVAETEYTAFTSRKGQAITARLIAHRVREGGEVLGRVETDRACFACTLGGPEGRTLFLLAADWRGTEHVDEAVAARTGQVLITQAPAPGAGWP